MKCFLHEKNADEQKLYQKQKRQRLLDERRLQRREIMTGDMYIALRRLTLPRELLCVVIVAGLIVLLLKTHSILNRPPKVRPKI